jgi:hypothetical protein
VLINIQVLRVETPRRQVNTFCGSEARLDPEDRGNTLFRNVCNSLPVDTAYHTKGVYRLEIRFVQQNINAELIH